MTKVDARGYLETEPFDFQINKNGSILIYWEGRQIKMLAGKEAAKAQAKLNSLDTKGIQLYLAKLTGNFKRGNERL